MATETSAIKRIVVGVDGSDQGAAGLNCAVRMATGMGSQIVAVYAIDAPAFFPVASTAQFNERWRAETKDEFENLWCQPLKVSGLQYRTVMEDGRPASVIAAVADREDADIIVVGRRGRGGVAELLLGSVSHELALHSNRPILLISLKKSRASE